MVTEAPRAVVNRATSWSRSIDSKHTGSIHTVLRSRLVNIFGCCIDGCVDGCKGGCIGGGRCSSCSWRWATSSSNTNLATVDDSERSSRRVRLLLLLIDESRAVGEFTSSWGRFDVVDFVVDFVVTLLILLLVLFEGVVAWVDWTPRFSFDVDDDGVGGWVVLVAVGRLTALLSIAELTFDYITRIEFKNQFYFSMYIFFFTFAGVICCDFVP